MARIERVLIGMGEVRLQGRIRKKGDLRVGNGPGYLIFSDLPDDAADQAESDGGNVSSYLEGLNPVGPVATKGLGAYKGGRLREEVAILALVPALEYEPKRSRNKEYIRLKNFVAAVTPIINRIKDIQTIGSKERGERLIDEFIRDLKSARKLNYSDLELRHPIDRSRKMAKGVYPHDHFVDAIVRLSKTKLKCLKPTIREILGEEGVLEKLCPTKGEVGDELKITQSHTTKLCRANGYFWLLTNRPGPA
jgi:hypothetical protein